MRLFAHCPVSVDAPVRRNDTIASFIIGADGTSTLVVLNAAATALPLLTVQLPAVVTSRSFYRGTQSPKPRHHTTQRVICLVR